MERGSEVSFPPHPPPAMGQGRRSYGSGKILSRLCHPVPRPYPAMALRGREQGSKTRLGPCPPQPTGQDWNPTVLTSEVVDSIAAKLGHLGMILLLFETPSGFALFSFCGIYLFEPHAMENLWTNFASHYKARKITILREFRTFDDKLSAINPCTGVNERLKTMILKYRLPGQKLAVGNREYKIIIENAMGIPCLCGENVMEAMRGLQNLMHILVPGEKSHLTKEDRLPMSHGLKKVLSDYGFDDLEPEMVNEKIMMTACALFHSDYIEKKYGRHMFVLALCIKDVSGIDTRDWNSLKLATALKVIFCPEEVGDYLKMFSEDERSKLVDDAHKYAREMGMTSALQVYKEIVSAYEVRNEKKILLSNLVTEAKEQLKLKDN